MLFWNDSRLFVLLFVGLFLFLGVVRITEHGLQVTPDCRHKDGRTQAGRDQVQEGRLCVLVEVHDKDSHYQPRDVSNERRPKVKVGVPLERVVIPGR